MRLIILLLILIATPALAKTVPAEAVKLKRELTRTAHYTYGITAPVSTLAALIHQESRWKHNAKSPVGAQGLAQFMPATANWMPEIYPQLQTAQPFDPRWSIRAMVFYTEWIKKQVTAVDNCEHWAFILSSYNGGLGWVFRDKRLASANGADSQAWFGNVEKFNSGRSAANFKENRDYPFKILMVHAPIYKNAGWGLASCENRWEK